jgi:HTH-type transcriptional regulator/antitoxin HipB
MTTNPSRFTPIEPQFDAPGLLRRARRVADLSQRDLAARAGVSANTVARVELGAGASFATMVRLFSAAGMRLVVQDQSGQGSGATS